MEIDISKRMWGQCNERTARGNATTSWCDKKMRGWRNERMTRGNATISGRRNERRHNFIVIRLQMELIGEVAAMVIVRIEGKPE